MTGTIAARDIGDARLTDYFYAFTGVPGDLLITVQSTNLNGDIDVFTANSLRPLLKFTVYSESSAPISKGLYLRKRENLVLRVEARTPNDDAGTYEIHFGGSFEPIPGGPLIGEAEGPATESATTRSSVGGKVRRVSSVGARIEEPSSPEVAAAPTPKPTPAESVKPPSAEKGTAAESAKSTPARSTRSSRPAGRRTATSPATTTAAAKKAATEGTEEARTTAEPEKTKESPGTGEVEAGSKKPSSPRREAKKRSSQEAATKAVIAPEPANGPRLIIQTREGTLIDRFMSTVRRIMVENGQIVVVGKDGKIQRVLLVEVVRMTIEP